MNERRRRIVVAGSALLASGIAPVAMAKARPPLVAFLDIESPGARGACENFRRAIDRKFANSRIKPNVAFVPVVQNEADETKQKLRRTLDSLAPDIILGANATFAEMARDFKLGRPILFMSWEDPVAVGYTNSLIRPSGGMTGFMMGASTSIKRQEMLLRLVPHCATLGIFSEERNGRPRVVSTLGAFGRLKKHYFYCDEVDELVKFLQTPIAGTLDAWDVDYAGVTFMFAAESVRAFSRTRRPVMYSRVRHVRLGGMAAFEPKFEEAFDTWAAQTAALLDGVPIENLPIMQVTRFSLALNLPALRQAGINPPKSLIKIADLVIQ